MSRLEVEKTFVRAEAMTLPQKIVLPTVVGPFEGSIAW